MPTISMFYGILVLMYFRDNRHQGMEASISIDDGSLLEGMLPSKQHKIVQAWIEIHKEELMVNWELAVNGEAPFRIAPLH